MWKKLMEVIMAKLAQVLQAIADEKAQVDGLKAQNAALMAQNTDLIAQNQALEAQVAANEAANDQVIAAVQDIYNPTV
jgi:regulator of replication initiation timing